MVLYRNTQQDLLKVSVVGLEPTCSIETRFTVWRANQLLNTLSDDLATIICFSWTSSEADANISKMVLAFVFDCGTNISKEMRNVFT